MDTVHICKSCGNSFEGNFCDNCGEKLRKQNDKSVKAMLYESFHFLSHFEGTLLKNIRTVWGQPGKFSVDYCNGIRKKYYKPLSFILFLVILYLIFPLFSGLNMELKFYKINDLWGKLFSNIIDDVQTKKQIDFIEISKLFHKKSTIASKFLLPTIIPVMALWSFLLTFRTKKYYYDHFIFATENLSFFLMYGFLVLPSVFLLIEFFSSSVTTWSENVIGSLIFAGVFIHLFISCRRFFKLSIIGTIFYCLAYVLVFAFYLQFIYKFLLFIISIYLI